jgi:hypothetical protein
MTKPPFDEVFYVPVPTRKLTKVESGLIVEIDPPWNGGIGGGAKVNFSELKKHGLLEKDLATMIFRQSTRKRDTDADEIYRLRSAISTAQELLFNAMRKDSFSLVENVCSLLGGALSGQRPESRLVNGR